MAGNGNGKDKRFVGQRKYNISKVWDVHHEIVRRLVIGQKAVDIAADLGVTEAMISYTRNSPVVKRQLELFHGARDADVYETSQEISKLAKKAVQKLEAALDNDNLPQLQMRAIQEVLDREVPKVSRFEGVTARLSGEDIHRLAQRAISVAKEAGIVIDQPPLLEAGVA